MLVTLPHGRDKLLGKAVKLWDLKPVRIDPDQVALAISRAVCWDKSAGGPKCAGHPS